MKKLLQINSVVNTGSTGRIVEEIGLVAMTSGWKSYIGYGRNKEPSRSELIKIGTNWEIKFHGFQTRLLDTHGFGSKEGTIKLIGQINTIKPDIIHLHNLHGYYINIEVLFNYLSRVDIPVVWTLHDCWAMTGHCTHFSLVGCEKWKTQCYNCPQTKAYPSSFIIDRSKKNYKLKKKLFTSVKNMTIVPVSSWLKGIVEESYLAKYPIRIINNGVDLDMFSLQSCINEIREKYSIGNRFMILGVATVWSNRKGLTDYLKLYKYLSKDSIIVLVGLSKNQLQSLPETFIGLPLVENTNELSKLYSTADVVLNLSSEETFGLTTVEGFACGTPGIVYNCTASPELITPETGFIVEQGDILGIAAAIKIIKEKGKAFYSSSCRDRAMKFFKKEDRYSEYIQLYESLIQ